LSDKHIIELAEKINKICQSAEKSNAPSKDKIAIDEAYYNLLCGIPTYMVSKDRDANWDYQICKSIQYMLMLVI